MAFVHGVRCMLDVCIPNNQLMPSTKVSHFQGDDS